jgi:hypothetical protein
MGGARTIPSEEVVMTIRWFSDKDRQEMANAREERRKEYEREDVIWHWVRESGITLTPELHRRLERLQDRLADED